MSCEGKDLHRLSQGDLAQAYRFHVWYLGHKIVGDEVSEGELVIMRRSAQSQIVEIQETFIGRFGVEKFSVLALKTLENMITEGLHRE